MTKTLEWHHRRWHQRRAPSARGGRGSAGALFAQVLADHALVQAVERWVQAHMVVDPPTGGGAAAEESGMVVAAVGADLALGHVAVVRQ